MLVTAQLMRFHCRIPQHYLVLLSLSGCVVFAASTSCLLDAAGLLCSAVAVLCARADGFAAAFMKVIGATRALLKALSELQIGALCNLQLCITKVRALSENRVLPRELSKLVLHSSFRRDRGSLNFGQNPLEC